MTASPVSPTSWLSWLDRFQGRATVFSQGATLQRGHLAALSKVRRTLSQLPNTLSKALGHIFLSVKVKPAFIASSVRASLRMVAPDGILATRDPPRALEVGALHMINGRSTQQKEYIDYIIIYE